MCFKATCSIQDPFHIDPRPRKRLSYYVVDVEQVCTYSFRKIAMHEGIFQEAQNLGVQPMWLHQKSV